MKTESIKFLSGKRRVNNHVITGKWLQEKTLSGFTAGKRDNWSFL